MNRLSRLTIFMCINPRALLQAVNETDKKYITFVELQLLAMLPDGGQERYQRMGYTCYHKDFSNIIADKKLYLIISHITTKQSPIVRAYYFYLEICSSGHVTGCVQAAMNGNSDAAKVSTNASIAAPLAISGEIFLGSRLSILEDTKRMKVTL